MERKIIHSLPRHSRGPPLNGKYPHLISASAELSHLAGRNTKGSGPYKSSCRCIWYTEYATGIPGRTSKGECPSAPPPRGRVVIFLQKRELIGTGGYSRSAVVWCQLRISFASRADRLTFFDNILKIWHTLDVGPCDVLIVSKYGANLKSELVEHIWTPHKKPARFDASVAVHVKGPANVHRIRHGCGCGVPACN